MQVTIDHGMAKSAAIEKLDQFLNGLMRQNLPGGIRLKDPLGEWDGDRMRFSLTVKKGARGAIIRGGILVTDQTIILDSHLPCLVTTFSSEENVQSRFQTQLKELFGIT